MPDEAKAPEVTLATPEAPKVEEPKPPTPQTTHPETKESVEEQPMPKLYDVRLNRVVKLGGMSLKPKDRHFLSEAAVKQLGDAVASATEVKK